MKKFLIIIAIIIIVLIVGVIITNKTSMPSSLVVTDTSQTTNVPINVVNNQHGPVTVMPIMHATAVLQWGTTTIYMDSTGEAQAFAGKSAANIILVTDIHSDHLSTSTLNAVIGSSTLIVPQAVKNMLPSNLAIRAKVLANGKSLTEQGFTITAIPMYNLPASSTAYHTKGRGNGYVIEKDGYRVYIAGDTSATPEMKALINIDLAFVPMNLPYTMSVDEAAEGVLAFKPKVVYPYHYKGNDGLSDVNKFKQLVNAGDSNIEVVLANWYPAQ